jgi:hypothetical protein
VIVQLQALLVLKKTTKNTLEGQRHESLLDKARSSLKYFRRSKTRIIAG